MSIPSPADLAARRPAPKPAPPATRSAAPTPPTAAHTKTAPEQPAKTRPRPEHAIAPGRLKDGEYFRKNYLFGIRFSGMHPHARLVGHDLMWRASHATGRIAPKLQPSIEQIALATGLTPMQVGVALQTLRTRGWLNDRPVVKGPRTGSTAYELTIPAYALDRIRTHLKRAPAHLDT